MTKMFPAFVLLSCLMATRLASAEERSSAPPSSEQKPDQTIESSGTEFMIEPSILLVGASGMWSYPGGIGAGLTLLGRSHWFEAGATVDGAASFILFHAGGRGELGGLAGLTWQGEHLGVEFLGEAGGHFYTGIHDPTYAATDLLDQTPSIGGTIPYAGARLGFRFGPPAEKKAFNVGLWIFAHQDLSTQSSTIYQAPGDCYQKACDGWSDNHGPRTLHIDVGGSTEVGVSIRFTFRNALLK